MDSYGCLHTRQKWMAICHSNSLPRVYQTTKPKSKTTDLLTFLYLIDTWEFLKQPLSKLQKQHILFFSMTRV